MRRSSLGGTLVGCALGLACAGGQAPRPGGPPAAPPAAVAAVSALPQQAPPPEVVAILGEISAERLRADVERLAAFGTRHTLSDPQSDTRGIGAARRWIADRLRAAGDALQVAMDRHAVAPDGRRIFRDVEIVNVVAELPGAMPEARGRRYYVVAHYDSRASDVMNPDAEAPGANDDGSGTALVIELARVLSRHRCDATLVFMATAGEEQGLYGARLHARQARQRGLDIRAVLNNDIVGDPTGPFGRAHPGQVRVFSEGLPPEADPETYARLRRLEASADSPSRQLARFVDHVAAWHALEVRPMLVHRSDRFLRGGDHTAFNEVGYAAVRFCEVEEVYERQHQDPRVENGVQYGDLPQFVDARYLAGVARLNAAVLVHLANAPSVPADARIVAAELAPTTTLRWSRSPEPDVAGYEVVWRETTAPQWQWARDVGDVTEATIELSKDNYFFGVRAYDQDGYRSPVAFPAAGRE